MVAENKQLRNKIQSNVRFLRTALNWPPKQNLRLNGVWIVTGISKGAHYLDLKKNTVNSWYKKDLKLQIQLHKAFFSDDWFLDSLHKSFLNQTTLDLRKEKWTFLNREFTVPDKGP